MIFIFQYLKFKLWVLCPCDFLFLLKETYSCVFFCSVLNFNERFRSFGFQLPLLFLQNEKILRFLTWFMKTLRYLLPIGCKVWIKSNYRRLPLIFQTKIRSKRQFNFTGFTNFGLMHLKNSLNSCKAMIIYLKSFSHLYLLQRQAMEHKFILFCPRWCHQCALKA